MGNLVISFAVILLNIFVLFMLTTALGEEAIPSKIYRVILFFLSMLMLIGHGTYLLLASLPA